MAQKLKLRSKEQVVAEIETGIKNNINTNYLRGVSMVVDPVIVQTTEEKIRQSYKFLDMISTTPTQESSGEILSLAEGVSIGQRTKVGTNNGNNMRRPIAVGGFSGRKFETRELELDVKIPWNVITQWGMQSAAAYDLYRNFILRSRAMARLRIGFYGQSENLAINSDLTTYPLMEDVQKGWFQYMIDNHPQNVFGITMGGITAKGYDINPIKIGAGGDFASMAQLIDYLKNHVMPRIYRANTAITAIVGDTLRNADVNRIIDAAGSDAMQLNAVESLMQMQTIGSIPAYTPDEMPERGVIVTDPLNLEYIYQLQSVERSIENSPDKKGLVDYQLQNVDFVIREVNACVMVHPDAIQLQNSSGTWVAAADAWAISPVV
ncbi:capsid protein [uncultured Caudovirales phage]|uniref:Capsid protein n=1 Tax=uncultured Caudovirales phage TaxID=2100421 RepID=A0A6J5S1J7_9CAUD|nr:capsid protein [uncultured Caudovirales phage]CAB4202257.1 capsid protein [uncultured Caudovirales phage]